jgi:hypothetical protein
MIPNREHDRLVRREEIGHRDADGQPRRIGGTGGFIVVGGAVFMALAAAAMAFIMG